MTYAGMTYAGMTYAPPVARLLLIRRGGAPS